MPPEDVLLRFHRLFYASGAWSQTHWLGVPCLKSPFDAWVYQEILHRNRPDVIVECGTAYGGSALFLAGICSLLGNGRVVTVDVNDEHHQRRPHDLISYVLGSSTAPETFDEVRAHIGPQDTVMVILDSDHRAPHVLQELRLYAPLVSAGHYMIAEDTNLNHEVRPRFGPGPREAVEQFLSETDEFTADPSCEKFLMSFNPGGFLLKQSREP